MSGTWILDSNLKRDSGFLKMNLLGSKPRIPDCTGKHFPDSGINKHHGIVPLHQEMGKAFQCKKHCI